MSFGSQCWFLWKKNCLLLLMVGIEALRLFPNRSIIPIASTFIKQAFESEYPKLLRLFNDLGSRLSQRQPIIIQSTTLNPTDPPTDVSITKCLEKSAAYSFGKTLSHFEAAYIARSLSRLLDSVNVVFPAGSKLPPSKDEIAGIVKTMTKYPSFFNKYTYVAFFVQRA
eukprot:m.32029 g.32029  ORF g.32029 m.32029 type:complete len:168 (+) comp31589_c0_seq2:2739-3242(+)